MSALSYWFFRFRSTLCWYWSAKTRYDVHSPFLSDFIEATLTDKQQYFPFKQVEKVRAYWQQQRGRVKILQQGAPSKINARPSRKVSELVAQSAIPDRWGEFLFRTALFNRAANIVELGTNAGISTLYLHLADRRAQLHTIEGNPEIARLAQRSFEIADYKPSLHQHIGTFDEVLPAVVSASPAIDLLFIDGDHRYQSTLKYVEACLPKAKPSSIFIIADIHWSPGMEKAWSELKVLDSVAATLDLGYFGVLFFQPEAQEKLHYNLIDTRWKPWRIGFF